MKNAENNGREEDGLRQTNNQMERLQFSAAKKGKIYKYIDIHIQKVERFFEAKRLGKNGKFCADIHREITMNYEAAH